MALLVKKLSYSASLPTSGINTIYLNSNNWDDYGHKTQFYVTVFDDAGGKYEIGDVKVGFIGHDGGWTAEQLPEEPFGGFGEGYFSLGQDSDYYSALTNKLPSELKDNFLVLMKDVIHFPELLNTVRTEQVFQTSLTRGINSEAVFTQFQRILQGNAILTPFNFKYSKPKSEIYSGINLSFDVSPDVKPPTNLHVLIGRNGIGKTTILNNMIGSLVVRDYEKFGTFYKAGSVFVGEQPINPDEYFSGVVSASFSAFDPFVPPPEQINNGQLKYSYIGLKNRIGSIEDDIKVEHKGIKDFSEDFVNSVLICFSQSSKKNRWKNAIITLSSDDNFSDMNLLRFLDFDIKFDDQKNQFKQLLRQLYNEKMSSGHAIVLLTITKLVEKIEEKTLVILDEPESHLHPPLLSAFTRALSELLLQRNGIAIIATHSPVILQEVPKSCVSIMTRSRLDSRVDRPELETFGENVGSLTREVFGLEVAESGFHKMLKSDVEDGLNYEQVLIKYSNQLGGEARALVKGMIYRRDQRLVGDN